MLPVWKGCPVARSDENSMCLNPLLTKLPVGERSFWYLGSRMYPDIGIAGWIVGADINLSAMRMRSIYKRMHLLILLFRRSKGQRMIFGFFICFHLACTYTIRNVYVNNQYVLYTYIVSKQVMNSHRTQADTDPRFGLNGTNPHFFRCRDRKLLG